MAPNWDWVNFATVIYTDGEVGTEFMADIDWEVWFSRARLINNSCSSSHDLGPRLQREIHVKSMLVKEDFLNIASDWLTAPLSTNLKPVFFRFMMTSSHGNIFCVIGPLYREFTGHRWIPCTKASDAELWCFLWAATWINGWVNNRAAGNLRRHRTHHIVTVIFSSQSISNWLVSMN